MAAERIQFRVGSLAAALDERGGAWNAEAAQIVARDVQRYYDLLALALAQVQLSMGEASLIVDALNGSVRDEHLAQALDYEISDSLQDGLAEKWKIDGPALVAQIRGWSLLQRMAVVDGVERFWSNCYHIDDMPVRLLRVGLVRVQA